MVPGVTAEPRLGSVCKDRCPISVWMGFWEGLVLVESKSCALEEEGGFTASTMTPPLLVSRSVFLGKSSRLDFSAEVEGSEEQLESKRFRGGNVSLEQVFLSVSQDIQVNCG